MNFTNKKPFGAQTKRCMKLISITENSLGKNNLLYVQSSIMETCAYAGSVVRLEEKVDRIVLSINSSDCYSDVIKMEICDKVAEVIAIKYKYDYFKKNLKVGGLSAVEKEILLTSLIAADLEDDKRYTIEKIKQFDDVTVDGIFNFRLKALKKKWQDVISYVPNCFLSSQLKEFISYLLENKRKRIYVEDGVVYDCHYRKLKRNTLMGGENAILLREALLSCCGEIELNGDISKDDEYYLREYFDNRIVFR